MAKMENRKRTALEPASSSAFRRGTQPPRGPRDSYRPNHGSTGPGRQYHYNDRQFTSIGYRDRTPQRVDRQGRSSRGGLQNSRKRSASPSRGRSGASYHYPNPRIFSHSFQQPLNAVPQRPSRQAYTTAPQHSYTSSVAAHALVRPTTTPSVQFGQLDSAPQSVSEFVQHDPSLDHISELPIFSPLFKDAENKSRKIVMTAREAVRPELQAHPKVWAPIDTALERSLSPKTNEPLRIGFCSDAGQGKSFAIGSLLCDMGLVKVGNSGESCTRVPIEYYYSPKTTYTPYSAEIRILPKETMVNRIERCVTSLFTGLFREDEDEFDELIQRKANIAKQVFQALFPDSPEWRNDETITAWLAGYQCADGRTLISRIIVNWVELLHSNLESKVYNLVLHEKTLDGFWKKLMPYTHGRRRTSDGGTMVFDPWPLVELVRIGSECPILENNITIGDTPGLDDHNYLNVDAARGYLERCSVTMVVNTIGRIISASHVRTHVTETIRRSDPGHKVVIVCTNTDSVDTEFSRDTAFTRQEESELQVLESEQDALGRQYQQCFDGLNPIAARDSILHIEFKRGVNALKKKELFLKERNRRVERELLKWAPRKDLERVFCISAMHYQQSIKGYQSSDPPILPKMTNMPSLRRFIASLPAETRQKRLCHYVRVDLPSLLGHVELGLPRLAPGSVAPVPNSLKSELKHVQNPIHVAMEDFFAKHVSDTILRKVGELLPSWIDHANAVCTELEKPPWGHRQHLAFLKNYGNHTLKSVGSRNWNVMFLKCVQKSLFKDFTYLMGHTDAFHDPIRQDLCAKLNLIRRHLCNNTPQPFPPKLETFIKSIKLSKSKIKEACEKETRFLTQAFRRQKERVMENNTQHFFFKEIKPIYEGCVKVQKVKGVNACTIRREKFRAEVCDDEKGPFAKIQDELQKNFDILRESSKKRLGGAVVGIFVTVSRDLDHLCDETESREGNTAVQNNRLLEVVKNGRAELKHIEGLLRECGAWKEDVDGPE